MEKKELVHKIYSEMASNSIKVKTYSKNQIITNFLANRNYIYFVLSGSCSLCSFSSKGELHLLQRYERYDCFGDIFHNIELNNEKSVIANTKTSVFYFDYDEIISNAEYHDIIGDICNMIILQMRTLNDRLEVLSKKTIRDRLLAYFDILSKRNIVKEFDLPMSYTQMASFLGVDRSAMAREIKQLELDRIISKNRHHIILNK